MRPAFLKEFNHIRIVSPSGVIDPAFIDGAEKVLVEWGLTFSEGIYARSEYGRFAGTKEQRINDLQNAFDDPDVKAILCSRGGYGLTQIIDKLNFKKFIENPKWLIGFSDITILHNALTNLNIPSVHGIMAKHLTELAYNAEQVIQLKNILFGKFPNYKIPAHTLNRKGEAKGKLIGGNLSVFSALRGTKYDLPYENNILFIEDIAEKPYHIDRMMQNLRLGGVLAGLSGLVVGQFSDCDEDPLMKQSIVEIILDAVSGYNYPVCFDFPAGHVDFNLPLVLGEEANLNVTKNSVVLSY